MSSNFLPGPTRDARGRFMPGAKADRRGAQPGNMNGVKHRWLAFWRRRALRPEDEWVRSLVSEFAGSLLSDKPDASEAERHVIETASVARGVESLILVALRDGGGVAGERGERLLATLARFMDIETRALLALGLARRPRAVDPLAAVRRAVEEANKA
jgi:hypothetical protein